MRDDVAILRAIKGKSADIKHLFDSHYYYLPVISHIEPSVATAPMPDYWGTKQFQSYL